MQYLVRGTGYVIRGTPDSARATSFSVERVEPGGGTLYAVSGATYLVLLEIRGYRR